MKKRYFLALNSFILIIIFGVISWFLSYDITLSIISTLLGLAFYLILSHTLIQELFESEKNLKEKIQKSMHEINTPVSTIQINSRLLKSSISDSKNLERLKKIDKASNLLLELYDEMEYFIKQNIDFVDIKSYDLESLVSESIQRFDDIKKDVLITLDIPKTTIKTDKRGFLKAVDNLIQNAIKHNQNLTKIEVFFKEKTLFIKDDGDGIESENICNVFNKYFKDHKAKGFGLGLSMVKEFCDKNGIDIKIESSKNGTVFKLNLSKIIQNT